MKNLKNRLKLINQNKILNIFLKFLLITTPVILLFLIIQNNNIFSFYPAPKFGDEMGYYRVTESFVSGEKYGNYGVSYSENVSAKYGGYSAHGPKYIVLYGIIGKIIGWHPYSILMIHIAFLVISLIIMLKCLKLDNKQLLSIILLFFSFFPLIYFYVSGMVEVLHYVFLLLYSIFLYKFIKNKSKRNYIFNFVMIFFLTLFRINYMAFYLPIIYLFNDGKINKKFIIHLLIAILLSLFSYLFISIFSAPYPSYLSEILNYLVNFNFVGVISTMFKHAFEVIFNYFSIKENSSFVIIFNYFYLVIMFIYFIIGVIKRNKQEFNIYFINFYILISQFIIIIFLYEVNYFKSVRILGAFLFLTILLIIYFNKKYIISFFVLSLLFLNYAIIGFNSYVINAQSNFSYEPLVSKPEEVKEINDQIKCSTSNRWDNTITVPNSYSYDSNIIYGLKSCVGINYIINDDYSKIKKSKYILVNNDETVNKKMYKLKESNSIGNLYIKK